MLDDSVNGTSLYVGKSVLSLVQWLLTVIAKSIQRQLSQSPAVDRVFGLSSDTAVPPAILMNKACDVLDQLLLMKPLHALGQIACFEDAGRDIQIFNSCSTVCFENLTAKGI
jgi:hypothetical protein